MGVGYATYAREAKDRSGKVRVSISVAVLIGTSFWSAIKCFAQDPLEIEDARRAEKQDQLAGRV
jgi:hypothetical protein